MAPGLDDELLEFELTPSRKVESISKPTGVSKAISILLSILPHDCASCCPRKQGCSVELHRP